MRGIFHRGVLKPGQTVGAGLYSKQQDGANRALLEAYSAIANRKCVILPHDNAGPHCAKRTLKKINEYEVLPHPPYSPDFYLPITAYSDQYNISLVSSFSCFFLKIWRMFKILCQDILLFIYLFITLIGAL